MLPPLVAFLVAGCLVFYICAAVPRLRRFALSASLWLASLAILIPAAFLPNIALLGILSERHLNAHVPLRQVAVHHVEALFLFNIIALMCVATVITLVHGFLIRRATFLLFRLYVSAVSVGVAITLVWTSYLIVSIMSGSFVLALCAAMCCILLTAIAVYVYRNAQQFRGPRPQWMQPTSTAEYGPANTASALAPATDAP
jgi:hypothetical protein